MNDIERLVKTAVSRVEAGDQALGDELQRIRRSKASQRPTGPSLESATARHTSASGGARARDHSPARRPARPGGRRRCGQARICRQRKRSLAHTAAGGVRCAEERRARGRADQCHWSPVAAVGRNGLAGLERHGPDQSPRRARVRPSHLRRVHVCQWRHRRRHRRVASIFSPRSIVMRGGNSASSRSFTSRTTMGPTSRCCEWRSHPVPAGCRPRFAWPTGCHRPCSRWR